MKKLGKYLLILSLFISTGTFAQKFGHINTNELLMAMPERATIEQEIKKAANQFEQQLLTMQKELETKFQDFQANEAEMSEAIRETRYNELTDLDQRIKKFQEKASKELGIKEQTLTEPLIEKARNAIETVAKENGFTYIFDSSGGFILYDGGGEDIMPLVKQKLGLE